MSKKLHICNQCRYFLEYWASDTGLCQHPSNDHTGHILSPFHQCPDWESTIMSGIDIHEIRRDINARDAQKV